MPSQAVLDELGKLADKATKDKSRVKLTLSACDLTDADVAGLAHGLLEVPVVAEMDLRRNRITDGGAKQLLRTMSEHARLSKEEWVAGEQAAMCLAHLRLEENAVSQESFAELITLERACSNENVRLEATWVFSKFLGEQVRSGIQSSISAASSCIVRFDLFQRAVSEVLDKNVSAKHARKLLGEADLYELDVQGVVGRLVGKMEGSVCGVSLPTFVTMCKDALALDDVLRREASKHRREIERNMTAAAPWATVNMTRKYSEIRDTRSAKDMLKDEQNIMDSEAAAEYSSPMDGAAGSKLRVMSIDVPPPDSPASGVDFCTAQRGDWFEVEKALRPEMPPPPEMASAQVDAMVERVRSRSTEGKSASRHATPNKPPIRKERKLRSPPPAATRPTLHDDTFMKMLGRGKATALHLDSRDIVLRRDRLVSSSDISSAVGDSANVSKSKGGWILDIAGANEGISSILLNGNKLGESDDSSSLWSCIRGPLGTVKTLNLSLNRLRSLSLISPASAVPNLEALILSSNALVSASTLKLCAFQSIQVLDLSHNMLKRICGLEAMHRLRDLDVSHNSIMNFTDVRALSLNKSLERLWLQGNPIEKKHGYRARLITQLPFLKNLDGTLMPPSSQQARQRKPKAASVKPRDEARKASTKQRRVVGASKRLYSPSPTRVSLKVTDLLDTNSSGRAADKQSPARERRHRQQAPDKAAIMEKRVSPEVWDRLASRLSQPKSVRRKHSPVKTDFGFGSKPPPPYFRPASGLYGTASALDSTAEETSPPTLADRRQYRNVVGMRIQTSSPPRSRPKRQQREVSPALLVHTESSVQKTLQGGKEADAKQTRRARLLIAEKIHERERYRKMRREMGPRCCQASRELCTPPPVESFAQIAGAPCEREKVSFSDRPRILSAFRGVKA